MAVEDNYFIVVQEVGKRLFIPVVRIVGRELIEGIPSFVKGLTQMTGEELAAAY